jgi:hypothetical protein
MAGRTWKDRKFLVKSVELRPEMIGFGGMHVEWKWNKSVGIALRRGILSTVRRFVFSLMCGWFSMRYKLFQQ